jgi:hypothetical protein
MERKYTSPGYRLPEALWQKRAPLSPKHPNTHRLGGGRPRVPDRLWMDGIRAAHRLSVESARCDRDLQRLDRPQPLSGVGGGGRVPAVLASRAVGVR